MLENVAERRGAIKCISKPVNETHSKVLDSDTENIIEMSYFESDAPDKKINL